MKYLLLMGYCGWVYAGEMPVDPFAVAPKEHYFEADKAFGGIDFQIKAETVDRGTEVTITAEGLEGEQAPITVILDARVEACEVGDLNADGAPEIYIHAGKELIAYSTNGNKSLSQISLPELGILGEGYRGGDQYSVIDGSLGRRFPIFMQGTPNSKPTGKLRQIQYKLIAGEDGWLLKPDQVLTIEPIPASSTDKRFLDIRLPLSREWREILPAIQQQRAWLPKRVFASFGILPIRENQMELSDDGTLLVGRVDHATALHLLRLLGADDRPDIDQTIREIDRITPQDYGFHQPDGELHQAWGEYALAKPEYPYALKISDTYGAEGYGYDYYFTEKSIIVVEWDGFERPKREIYRKSLSTEESAHLVTALRQLPVDQLQTLYQDSQGICGGSTTFDFASSGKQNQVVLRNMKVPELSVICHTLSGFMPEPLNALKMR